LWNVVTGKVVRRWGAWFAEFYCLAVSRDGKTLAAGGKGKAVLVWDVASGKELKRLRTPGPVVSLAFSPTGKTLAVAEGSPEDSELFKKHRVVKLWDVAAGKVVRKFIGQTHPAEDVAISPDGKILAAAAEDKTIRVWDLATGKTRCTIGVFKGVRGDPMRLLFLAGRKTLAAAGDDRVRLFDATSGREVERLAGHQTGVRLLAFAPDGKALAAAGAWDPGVQLWEPATGTRVHWLAGHRAPVHFVVFSPDGKTLVTAAGESWDLTTRQPAPEVKWWDRATGKERAPLRGLPKEIGAVAFSPDGKTLAVAGGHRYGKAGTLKLWSSTTGRVRIALRGHTKFVTAVAFSPDGTMLAAADADQQVKIWDLTRGKSIRSFPGVAGGFDHLFAFSADGRVLMAGGRTGPVCGWHVATGKKIPGPGGVEMRAHSAAFCPDTKVVAAGWGEKVLLWQAETGKELHRFSIRAEGDPTRLVRPALAFSPDGRVLAAVNTPKTLHLWEVATGQEIGRCRGHQKEIGPVGFSPDGRTVATGSGDATVLVWDLTGRLRGGRLPAVELAPQKLDALWADLASADAARAQRAVWTLVCGAPQSVPFLEKNLRPVPEPDSRRVARLLADLNNRRYALRQKATKELEKLEGAADGHLRRALQGKISLEARRRLQGLLERGRIGPGTPERRRGLRGIQVLEQLGTSEARKVLEVVAKGADQAGRTREAKAALKRLARRPGGR
jgi:WD40 repeat protein